MAIESYFGVFFAKFWGRSYFIQNLNVFKNIFFMLESI